MVKINASPELVEELKRVVAENSGVMELDYAGPSDQPSHLRLGLGEVSTITATLTGPVPLAKFAHSIYEHLSEKKLEKMTLQTPLRTIEIMGSDAVSEDRILKLIESSVRV